MSGFHSVWVALAAVFFAVLAAPAAARATVVPDVPPASTLETGDFLWPKLPNRVVPYDSRPGAAAAADRQRWEEERRAELARLEHLPALTPQEKERYRILSGLTYDAFLGLYLSDRPEGTVTPLGDLAIVATGHVAIVDVRQGVPYVIEAIPYQGRLGVRDLTYPEWLAGRPGEKVWHARLQGRDPGAARQGGGDRARRTRQALPLLELAGMSSWRRSAGWLGRCSNSARK